MLPAVMLRRSTAASWCCELQETIVMILKIVQAIDICMGVR